jgi:hypothetical protein
MSYCFPEAVIPIYAEKRDGWSSPKHIGTGTLIASSKRHFLVSAAHVMAERKNSPLYLHAGGEVEITHDIITSCNLKDDSSKTDSVDACFLVLKDDEAKRIASNGFRFIPVDKNNLYGGEDDLKGCRFILVGYPSFSVNLDHQNQIIEIDPKEIHGLGSVSDKRRERLEEKWDDVHPRATLVLDIAPTVSINECEVKRPSQEQMQGISGGAIWADFEDGPKMVGIMVGFEASHSVVLGTRLRPILNVMADRHPGD